MAKTRKKMAKTSRGFSKMSKKENLLKRNAKKASKKRYYYMSLLLIPFFVNYYFITDDIVGDNFLAHLALILCFPYFVLYPILRYFLNSKEDVVVNLEKGAIHALIILNLIMVPFGLSNNLYLKEQPLEKEVFLIEDYKHYHSGRDFSSNQVLVIIDGKKLWLELGWTVLNKELKLLRDTKDDYIPYSTIKLHYKRGLFSTYCIQGYALNLKRGG